MDSRKRQKRHEKRVQAAAKKRIKEQRKQEATERKGNEGGKKSFVRTFVTALIIFVVVFAVLGTVINNFLETSPFQNGEEEEEVKFEVLVDPESVFFQEFSDSKRINILVLGVNPPLTDTIMLASFDPEVKRVDVISVPRDTYYYRAEYAGANGAYHKINAAYEGNPLNSAKAVSDVLLGIPINYYAVVEYSDIMAIVDEMGGVPMYIESPMQYSDPWDTTLDPNGLVINIPAGQQVLDGENSIKFLRYRSGYAEGDIGRVKAQQAWLKNALAAAIDHGILKCANVAFEEIDSNITYKAMISLGTKALGMESENIYTYTIPNTLQQEPPWYVYPDTTGIEEMLREIYSIVPEETTDGAIEEGA